MWMYVFSLSNCDSFYWCIYYIGFGKVRNEKKKKIGTESNNKGVAIYYTEAWSFDIQASILSGSKLGVLRSNRNLICNICSIKRNSHDILYLLKCRMPFKSKILYLPVLMVNKVL